MLKVRILNQIRVWILSEKSGFEAKKKQYFMMNLLLADVFIYLLFDESQTTRIPGRVKLKQWENLLRPTFQMTINIDLLKLFLYFFFQKLGTPFVFSNFLSPVKNSLPA